LARRRHREKQPSAGGDGGDGGAGPVDGVETRLGQWPQRVASGDVAGLAAATGCRAEAEGERGGGEERTIKVKACFDDDATQALKGPLSYRVTTESQWEGYCGNNSGTQGAAGRQ